MKLCLLSTFFAVFAVAACAESTKTQIADGPANPDMTTSPDGGMTTPADESDDPANQPPHSLGTITLGESHGSGTSHSTPLVSAVFVPDALLTRACTTKLDSGCVIQAKPKCNSVSTTTTGCNSNEACTLDNATCTAVCKPFAVCETPCASDEVCKANGTGTGTGATGTCVKSESFDAGPIAFSGTTTEITLFPPYAFESTGQGAPFLGGAEIHVQASGAVDAGFDKFDEKFTATTFIQTSPQLSKISRQAVFGTGSLPIGWAPGTDTVVITVSGAGGSAICKVQDSLGKFDLPRSVIEAAQGDSTTTTGSETLSISVARQHRDVKKDKHAKGQLSLATVKPDGWLELVTLSSESASFQGCGTGQAICGDSTSTSCTNLTYDNLNCGACGNICPSSQPTCSSGKCGGGSTTTCTSCRSNAEGGSCSSQYSACTADVNCDNLAYCAQSCTTSSCVSSCESTYSTGYTKWSPLKSCLTTYCSSTCGF